MFDPPDEPPDSPSLLKRLYDEGQSILSDYKQALSKAIDPLRSIIGSNVSLSSRNAIWGSQAETITPHLYKKYSNTQGAAEEDHDMDTDFDPDIDNPSILNSKETIPYSVERYLKDESDYRSYFVSEYESLRIPSTELHHIYLKSMIGRVH